MQAFRSAAVVVDAMDDAELERRIRTGTLKDLKGIGAKTAAVIVQAANGQIPDYLAGLEEKFAELIPLADDVAEFRAALRGDLHTHSDWSDGGSLIREMAEAAMALGHEYLALTDHSPRLTVANGLTAERLEQQLDVVAALNEELAPFRILTGIECDINVDGSLDQTDELLGRLDVVVASVHSDLRADAAAMTARIPAADRVSPGIGAGARSSATTHSREVTPAASIRTSTTNGAPMANARCPATRASSSQHRSVA